MSQTKPRLGGLFLISLLAANVQAQQPVFVPVPPATPGTHPWFPSSPLEPGQSIPANGTVVGHSGVVGTLNPNPNATNQQGPFEEFQSGRSVLRNPVWSWGNLPAPPAVYYSLRSAYWYYYGQHPDNAGVMSTCWFLHTNTRWRIALRYLANGFADPAWDQGFHFPLGSRLNVNLMLPLARADFLPPSPTIAGGSDPMLPAGMGEMATGWKGQSRPTLEGQVDLVTGKPLVQVMDLELPFGSTVFRLNRTRSSLVAHDAPAINRQRVSMPAIADAWWDWAGEGWMLSENPLLVIDAQWVDAGTSDMPPTSWLVLDAHRSIPFQNIQGSRRYEAPPRFRATMEVIEGKKLLVDRVTGKPTNDQSQVNSKLVWWSEPTRAKVTLYDGALTYWFAIIPKDYKPAIPVLKEGQQIADPQSATPGIAAGLIPPNRYFLSYLKSGSGLRAENLSPVVDGLQWVDGDYSDRPLNPDSMRALVSGDRSDPRYFYRAFYQFGGGWGPDSTPTIDSGSPTVMPGFGLPRLALLTKIEDRAGNEVHIEYVDTRTTVIDDPATPEVEYVQDGQSIGQIKAVHLVDRKTNRSGTTTASNEKELSWTLLYVHRSTAGIAYPTGARRDETIGYVWNLIAGNGTPQNPGNRELLGMHGERVLDRVLAYKGGLSRNVLDQITAADLTIGVEDRSGFFGRTNKVEDLLGKVFSGEQQTPRPLGSIRCGTSTSSTHQVQS